MNSANMVFYTRRMDCTRTLWSLGKWRETDTLLLTERLSLKTHSCITQ